MNPKFRIDQENLAGAFRLNISILVLDSEELTTRIPWHEEAIQNIRRLSSVFLESGERDVEPLIMRFYQECERVLCGLFHSILSPGSSAVDFLRIPKQEEWDLLLKRVGRTLLWVNLLEAFTRVRKILEEEKFFCDIGYADTTLTYLRGALQETRKYILERRRRMFDDEFVLL